MSKSQLFKFDGQVDSKTMFVLSMFGVAGFLLTWWVISLFSKPQILPSPYRVLLALKELLTDGGTYKDILFSVKLNLLGYVYALLITIPAGFLIALYPGFRGLFSANINAARYLPLTAVTGLFITWFGLKFNMKAYFMGFSILIYLLPAMIQRVDEVEKIHKQIIHTLGATTWQKFKYVFFPSTMPKFWRDVRLLTAISWTYIIVAELLYKTYGVGAMVFNAGKQSRTDQVIGILIIIIAVGMLQDVIFIMSHRLMFPHDYNIYRKKTIVLVPVDASEIAKPAGPDKPVKKNFLQRLNLMK
jgi:NitT/TauT family transport system permease protein